MHWVAIAVVVALVVALFGYCAYMWYRTLREIDIDVSDWDRHAFDDFYDELGRITSRHN